MRLTRWDQQFTSEQSNEVLFRLSQCILQGLDGTKEQVSDLSRLIDGRDLKGLCSYELSFAGLTVDEYRNLRQVLAFFTKNRSLDIGIDTRAVAFKKAMAAEQQCRDMNDIFRCYFQGGFMFPLDVESVLYRAQCKIADILGVLPCLEDIKLRFGPGATTQVKKKEASVRRKLNQKFACSEELAPFVGQVLAEMPHWSQISEASNTHVDVEIHQSRMSFVRKNAKTDRSICVEPSLNLMVQLGVGDYMADRLRSAGVDIRDQSRNQRLAREGSITNALATLDLSSASDTISTGLVETLLPFDWYNALSILRSEECVTPDGIIRQSKFSSMGNGFTFPLETLIFFGLAYACTKDEDYSKVSVYGDDIIVPTYAYPLLCKTLQCVGLTVNMDKSFFDGPFRESCGKDYYYGTDVRPCYVKDALSGQTCFVLHNYFVRNWQPGLASAILEYVDESLRIYGPDGFGDGHLLGEFVKTRPSEPSWGGYIFETFTYKSRSAFYKLGADYVFPLYSIYLKDREMPQDEGALRKVLLPPRLHRLEKSGSFRPDRGDAVYAMHSGREYLKDVLPGVDGYKRIKVYTLG